MMNCMMGMGMMMFLGLLLLLGVGAAVVLAVIWLARQTRTTEVEPEQQHASSEGGQQNLKLRYARGEIDAEEYVRMKRELGED